MATSFFFPVLLLLHILLLFLRCSADTPLLPLDEVSALTEITLGLDGYLPIGYDTRSCVDGPDDGITCDCSFIAQMKNSPRNICAVVALSFPNRDFSGVISSAVGNLTNLTKIDLSGNKLHGPIPTSLGKLSLLDELDLSYNQLNESIQVSFGKLQSLQILKNPETWQYLRYTQGSSLSSLPLELGTPSLRFNFLEGHIPPSLGDLLNLTSLDLTSNLLKGQIPSQLGNAGYLGDNNLSGTIPPELGNLQELIVMQISGNNFTGELPHTFENFNKLEIFSVRGNDLSGPVPDFITKWRYLEILVLMGNNFVGVLPTGIFQLKYLTRLWVTDLNVSANFSFPQLSNLTSLESLILRNCSIVGGIPDYVAEMEKLHDLDLSYNNLTGEIPAGLKNLDYMFTFSPAVQTEIMKGSCPHEKHYSLYINCGGNGTTVNGSYYEEDTSNLPFHISPQKWAYSSSSDNTKHMTYGISVPDALIYANARISPLTLDYYGLCLRNGEYNVTLHFAEIVFWSKDDHSILGKRVFDIFIQGVNVVKDFNIKDEAHGPNERVSKTFPANVTDNTLNIHLYWAGKGSIDVDPPLYGPLISAIAVTSDYKPGKKLSTGEIAAITAICVALPLIILVILRKLGYLPRKKFELEGEALRERKITLQNILDGTHSFSPKMEIGSGGSGKVYKAILRDESVLAVKKIQSHSLTELDEFLNEVRTLESLKNENLVQLLGWYSRDGQILLIYKYMEKNSLQKTFFETKSEFFSWEIRYRICLQIAKGLVYLHTNAIRKIIHRDIKSSNILLDKDLNAKISDFGLARIYREEQGTIFTKLCGTHGYMAPEYAMRGILSEKTDVYSHGVVVLEIVSGKSNATYNSSQEGEFLLDQAYVLQNDGSILNLIDAAVKNKPGYHAKQASKLLDLAMMCTRPTPSLRPTMSEVVSVLENESTIEEISAAKHNNKPSNDSKHITASGSPVSVESTSTSFSGISV